MAIAKTRAKPSLIKQKTKSRPRTTKPQPVAVKIEIVPIANEKNRYIATSAITKIATPHKTFLSAFLLNDFCMESSKVNRPLKRPYKKEKVVYLHYVISIQPPIEISRFIDLFFPSTDQFALFAEHFEFSAFQLPPSIHASLAA